MNNSIDLDDSDNEDSGAEVKANVDEIYANYQKRMSHLEDVEQVARQFLSKFDIELESIMRLIIEIEKNQKTI